MDYTRDVQKALDYIEKNLNSKIDTKELAQIVGMSVYHFHRVFKKEIKVGIYKYIQKRRMSQAALLLLNSDLSILTISLISGFSSQEAFTRVFKRYYKMPPHQYKMQFKHFFRRQELMNDQEIKHWMITGENFDKYEVSMDYDMFHSDKKSVKIQGPNEKDASSFATVMQQINSKNYRNKRVKLSAYLKTEDVVGWAGIWFRIDGKNFNQLKFDNMEDRPIVGTNTWNYYSSVLDVPDEAERLVFGFLLQGPGILWADDFSINVVGNDVKTTDFNSELIFPDDPNNLSFTD